MIDLKTSASDIQWISYDIRVGRGCGFSRLNCGGTVKSGSSSKLHQWGELEVRKFVNTPSRQMFRLVGIVSGGLNGGHAQLLVVLVKS